jgi:glutaredoxin
MKRKATRTAIVTLMLVATVFSVSAQNTLSSIDSPNGPPLDGTRTVVLFYSDSCPHCHNEIRWLERIRSDFPGIEFRRFEVAESNDRANQRYFADVMEALDSVPRGWPRTVIGDRVFVGFVPNDGELVYNEEYGGYLGYRNQIYAAIEELAEAL